MTSTEPTYGMVNRDPEIFYVTKSWHWPPGTPGAWRGWAVMRGGEELSVHESVTEAYEALDAIPDAKS